MNTHMISPQNLSHHHESQNVTKTSYWISALALTTLALLGLSLAGHFSLLAMSSKAVIGCFVATAVAGSAAISTLFSSRLKAQPPIEDKGPICVSPSIKDEGPTYTYISPSKLTSPRTTNRPSGSPKAEPSSPFKRGNATFVSPLCSNPQAEMGARRPSTSQRQLNLETEIRTRSSSTSQKQCKPEGQPLHKCEASVEKPFLQILQHLTEDKQAVVVTRGIHAYVVMHDSKNRDACWILPIINIPHTFDAELIPDGQKLMVEKGSTLFIMEKNKEPTPLNSKSVRTFARGNIEEEVVFLVKPEYPEMLVANVDTKTVDKRALRSLAEIASTPGQPVIYKHPDKPDHSSVVLTHSDGKKQIRISFVNDRSKIKTPKEDCINFFLDSVVLEREHVQPNQQDGRVHILCVLDHKNQEHEMDQDIADELIEMN